jgi:hypothetical protein
MPHQICTSSLCLIKHLIPILYWLPALAQTTIQADVQHGYILPEYSNMQYLINAPAQGFSLSYVHNTKGKNYWERIYGYPEMGVSMFYSSLGNNEVNGHEWAAVPFIRFKLLGNEKMSLFHQMGLGLSYVSKKFDLETNYQNITTGSHINLHFTMRSGVKLGISNKVALIGGLSFDHFSNGNTFEPNLGLNTFAAFAGLNYTVETEKAREFPEIPALNKAWTQNISIRFGGKRARALVDEYFNTFSATYSVSRNYKHWFHLGAGIDAFYDASTRAEMEAAQSGPYLPRYDFQSGLHVEQTFVYNAFSFTLQEGFYLGLKYKVKNRPIYTRGFLKYTFSKHLAVSFAMKSHFHILDFPELGFDYKW